MYNLYHSVPYEGEYCAFHGSRDELLQFLRNEKNNIPLDDLTLLMDPTEDLYGLAKEAYDA